MKRHNPLTKFLACILIGVVVTLPMQVATAADITPGITFGNSDTVTAAKLNALGAGTIKTSWLTGMSALSVDPDTADLLLLYDTSAAGYRRITVGTALYNNSTLGAAVAATAGASNVIWQVTTALVGITNYALTTNPNYSNTIPIWDVVSGVQKQIAMSNIWGTFVAEATITSNSVFNPIQVSHGFGVTPKWVRVVVVCTNAGGDGTAIYLQNDEVDASQVHCTGLGGILDSTPALSGYANATTIWVKKITPVATLTIPRGGGSSATYATMASNAWVVRVYAHP